MTNTVSQEDEGVFASPSIVRRHQTVLNLRIQQFVLLTTQTEASHIRWNQPPKHKTIFQVCVKGLVTLSTWLDCWDGWCLVDSSLFAWRIPPPLWQTTVSCRQSYSFVHYVSKTDRQQKFSETLILLQYEKGSVKVRGCLRTD